MTAGAGQPAARDTHLTTQITPFGAAPTATRPPPGLSCITAVPACLRRCRPGACGAGNCGAARAFKMVPVPGGSLWRVTGIEPGRAGMLTEFAGLSTPLVADACIRRKVPLRVAPPGISAVIPGQQIAGRALPARHYGSVDV